MDDISESKRAVDLLTSRYSIIDFGGEVRYLKNSNVEELLRGEVNPLTTGLKLYRKGDIELFQQRDLENAGLPVEQKQFREIMDGWRINPKTKCFHGTDFDPTNTDPNVLNLWRGPIGGQEGDWAVIHEFLLLIICNRDQVKYDYLLDFLAHAIQKPEEKPGVMLFFQGGQGTGKGTFFELIRKIWRYTTLVVQDVKEVVGDFNGGLEQHYFVLMDEALFAGDGKSANALKSMVTEPVMRINEKNQPRRTIGSKHRFVAATNSDVVGRVDPDDRRFFICEVSRERQQDTQYFGRLRVAFGDGVTVPAFVNALETRDLSEFEVRLRPKTKEHGINVLAGLRGVDAFLYDCIQQGQLGYENSAPIFRDTETHVTNAELVEAYKQFRSVDAAKYDHASTTKIKQHLKKVLGEHVDAKVVPRNGIKTLVRGVKFPPLEVMRAKILAHYKIDETTHDWDSVAAPNNSAEKTNGISVISGTETVTDTFGHTTRQEVPWGN